MEDEKDTTQRHWVYVKMPEEILEELHHEAQLSGLVPSKLKRGQSAVKLGALKLIIDMLRERQKKRKRKEGKE